MALPDDGREELRRLVGDDMVARQVGVPVAEPAVEVAEMGIQPVVEDDHVRLPTFGVHHERPDKVVKIAGDLGQRVTAVVVGPYGLSCFSNRTAEATSISPPPGSTQLQTVS